MTIKHRTNDVVIREVSNGFLMEPHYSVNECMPVENVNVYQSMSELLLAIADRFEFRNHTIITSDTAARGK